MVSQASLAEKATNMKQGWSKIQTSKSGKKTAFSAGQVRETSEMTWPLPIAEDLSSLSTSTTNDTTAAFPDYRNPANNLILARTALLGNLDILQSKQVAVKHQPKRPLSEVIQSIHSRVIPYSGHIKENEDLTRARAELTKTLKNLCDARAHRAKGNKGKLFSERHLRGFKRAHAENSPLSALQEKMKLHIDARIEQALAYEGEYGWDVLLEDPWTLYGDIDSKGKFRDFQDPYWHLTAMSPLQPGGELTRKLIIALLKLKNTFPDLYGGVEINMQAAVIGLGGWNAGPRVPDRQVVVKPSKASRLLGFAYDFSSRKHRRKSSSWLSLSSDESSSEPDTSATHVDKSRANATLGLKAKTTNLVRRVASKISLRRHGKHPDSDSDFDSCEDSDDEYAAAAEFLKQEAKSKEKVSQWLTLGLDGESLCDRSSTVSEAVESTELSSPPTISKSVLTSASPAPTSPVVAELPCKTIDKSAGAATTPVKSTNKFAAYTPISTFSPFDAINNQAPASPSLSATSTKSGSGSDSDSDLNQHTDIISFRPVQAITLQRPTTPARMVSIRKKTKASLKRTASVLSSKPLSKPKAKGSATGPEQTSSSRSSSSSSSSSASWSTGNHAFHGGFID
ncbi:hypothetical protein LTR84_006641 [Exophiala bonariae]|uniref:Uncharacterized protein n=1 Tax=Exophiala bonariae TaxID=1690606 RepID=A0AAV9N0V6_9EURO|nr:hypothetical protein LTR84_006641 [Exophiala bonariae]